MDCTICKGIKEVYHRPREHEQDPGGWEPCEHCKGTGVEPPDGEVMDMAEAVTVLTKAEMLSESQQRQRSRDDATLPDSRPNERRLYSYRSGS